MTKEKKVSEPSNIKDVNAAKRRLKRVLIQPAALLSLFGTCIEGKYFQVEGIPAGSKCVSMAIDPSTMLLVLFLEHESFEAIDINKPVPEQAVQIRVGGGPDATSGDN